MKLKILNKNNLHEYSKGFQRFESIFENDELGLSLSYFIYKIKLGNENVSFSEFLNDFFINKKGYLPHFIEPEIYLYRLGKNKEEKVNTEDIFNQLYESDIILRTIIGEAGSGKTTTFLSLVHNCYERNNDLSKIFSCCHISINKNYNNVEDILSYSLDIEKEYLDNYLLNTYSTIFFIDANAISKTVEKNNKQFTVKVDNIDEEKLLDLIDSIKEKLELINRKSNKKHRLFIMYRSKKEYFDKYTNKLHNYLNTHSYIYEVQGLREDEISEYINKISGENGKELLIKINSISLLKIPLFVDLINWLSIKMETTLKNYNILSFAHLYLIFTREFFRYKPLRKQWQKKDIFEWVQEKRKDVFELEENEFAKVYNDNIFYKLEKFPHPIDLLLMIISVKLGNSFYKSNLIELLNEIISKNEKYSWLKEYKNDEKNPLYNQIIENSIIRIGNGKELELLHHSFSDYYIAKSIFYDLEKGELVDLENKKHYEDKFNNIKGFDIIPYFINIFNLLFDKKNENINDFFDGLDLTSKVCFYIAKAFDNIKDYDNSIRWYKKTIEIDPKHFLSMNNLGLIYKDLKKYDKAIEMFELSMSLNSSYDHPVFNMASLYKELNEYDKSENYYKKSLELNPNDYDTNTELSDLYAIQKDENNAIKVLDNYYNLSKDKTKYYYDYYYVYFKMGNYEKAIYYLEKALEDETVLEYEKNNYIGIISDLYKKIGNIEKSNEYKESLEKDFLYYLNEIINSNDIEYINKLLKILEERYFNHDFFFNNLGFIYLNKLNDFDKAEIYFKKACEQNILEVQQLAFSNLGYIYFLEDNYEESLYYYLKSYEMGLRFESLYSGIIRNYTNLNLFEEANYYIQESINKFPDNIEINYAIADYFRLKKEYKESLKYFLKSIDLLLEKNQKIGKENFFYTDDIITGYLGDFQIEALYYSISNNYEALFVNEKNYEYYKLAEEYYLKIINNNPIDKLANFELACFYIRNNEEEKGIRILNNYCDLIEDKTNYNLYLAKIYKDVENYENAIFHLEKELDIINDIHEKSSILYSISYIYKILNKLDLSEEYLNKSLELYPNNEICYTDFLVYKYEYEIINKDELLEIIEILKNKVSINRIEENFLDIDIYYYEDFLELAYSILDEIDLNIKE